jgi:hypothetical protein
LFFHVTLSPCVIEIVPGEKPVLLIETLIVAAPALAASASAAAVVASIAVTILMSEPPQAQPAFAEKEIPHVLPSQAQPT